MKTIALLDGNALIHRAFHAIPAYFSTKEGEPTNATYGFTKVLMEIVRQVKPEYFVVAFDKKGPTFRHIEYKEYKATRKKAPDELYAQIPRIKEVVQTFGIPIFEIDGFEADDVIGTLAKQGQEHGLRVVIVTGDMDALQLVNHHVVVTTMHKGFKETITYDADEVMKKCGLRPEQIVDYKALRGDPSDNIKGVPGIGEKTAAVLLQKYETLDGLYAHLDELTAKIREKLSAHREDAYLSQRLARIVTDVPITLDLHACTMRAPDQHALQTLFAKLEFKSLLRQLELYAGMHGDHVGIEEPIPQKIMPKHETKPAAQQTLF